ncbi:DUF6507 family protein [Actinomadura darangshiensis]|nr:DUF6507 family protein [Actinomadura darangshiensis]
MSGWDIEPRGVGSILIKVLGLVEDPDDGLEKVVGDVFKHVGEAGTAAMSEPIATALGEYAKYAEPQLNGMVSTTGRCVSGTYEAVKAYIDGDLEMAAEAQEKAAGVGVPRIPRLGDR